MSDRIDRAREYIAKGEEFYAKAADEIVAAFEEGMSFPTIARELGRSVSWVKELAAWRRSGTPGPNSQDPLPTPFAGQYEERIERAGRQAVRERPEVIVEMVEELHDNPAFQAAVASASSRIEAKREQRTEERVQVERGISEAEVEFERLRRDMRDGNYGEAERRLQKLDVDEVVAAYMRQQGDRFKYLMEWAHAWGDAKPIQDEQLQEWLA